MESIESRSVSQVEACLSLGYATGCKVFRQKPWPSLNSSTHTSTTIPIRQLHKLVIPTNQPPSLPQLLSSSSKAWAHPESSDRGAQGQHTWSTKWTFYHVLTFTLTVTPSLYGNSIHKTFNVSQTPLYGEFSPRMPFF